MTLPELRQRIRDAEDRDFNAEAVELMVAYLELDPANIAIALAYGEKLRVLGRLNDAHRFLTSLALDQIPLGRRHYFHLNLGEIYEGRGDLLSAERSYLASVEAQPDSTVPWVFLGAFFAKRERLEEAISALKSGLNAKGDLDEVHYNLGNCYRAKRDYDAARGEYEAALGISPDYELARSALEDVAAASACCEEFRRSADGTTT